VDFLFLKVDFHLCQRFQRVTLRLTEVRKLYAYCDVKKSQILIEFRSIKMF